jgi:hypothetical protein
MFQEPRWVSQYNDELPTDRPGFDSRQKEEILVFTAPRPNLGSIQPPIQCVEWAVFPGINWPGREADHLSRSSAEVKICRAISLLRFRLHDKSR